MPNWCSNQVSFLGTEQEITAFKESLVETVNSQKIAGSRVLVMVLQEQFEPGYIANMSVAILHDRMKNNVEIDEQLFHTISHIWSDFDKENLSEKWEDVWEQIKFDWGFHATDKIESFQDFIEKISKPVSYKNIPDGDTPFDFAQFCPLRLTSVLLGFNSLTEEWIDPLVKALPDNNYRTQNALWGTKWNAVSPNISRHQPDNGFSLYFQTAWSPPIPVYEALSEQYPEITVDVTFSEYGCDYQGRMVFKAGETIFEREDEIHWVEDDEGNQVETIELEWMEMPLEKLLGGA